LLNPGAVVLSGPLLESYPGLTERLLKEYYSQKPGLYNTPFRLTKSGLGRDSVIIGAAAHLLYTVYDEYI